MRTRRGSNQYKTKRNSQWKGWLFYYFLFFSFIACFSIGGKMLKPINTTKAYADSYLSPLPTSATRDNSGTPKTLVAGQSATQIATPTATPTPTDSIDPKIAYIEKQKHADIIIRIYGLESSFGRNDGCRDHGTYNGFGFDENTADWTCYNTFNTVVDHVESWLEDHMDTQHMTLRQVLCIYNQGSKNLCPYAEHFLDLPVN